MSILCEIAKHAPGGLGALCLMFSFGFRAQGQTCSNANLSGTYFLLQQGAYLSTGSSVAVSGLEKIVADGNGGITGTGTVHVATAEVDSGSLSGTYKVNSDCSGTLTVTITPQNGAAQTSSSAFQLAHGGQELLGLKTQTADVETVVAYRAAAQCSTASLTGSYAFSQTGMNLVPSFDLYSIVSPITFDGNGGIKFNGTENEILGSGSFPFTGSGTYSVSSDCSGTMSLPPHNRNAIALVEGGRVLGLEIDPNEYTASDILEPVSTVTDIPHIAVNGGWNTDLIFVNSGSTAVNAQVNFISEDGSPWQLTVLPDGAASSTTESSAGVSIPAQGRAILHTVGDPAIPPVGGWAQATGGGPFTAYAVFGWPLNGQTSNGLTQAVSYNACGGNTSVTVPFDDTGGRYFGVAVSNLANHDATIMLAVVNSQGIQAQQASLSTPLVANGHTQFLLSDVIPATNGANGGTAAAGTVTLTSSAGPLAVTALQFNSNGSFTSVPISCQ